MKPGGRSVRREPGLEAQAHEESRLPGEARDPRDPIALNREHHHAVRVERSAPVLVGVCGERRLAVRASADEADPVEATADRVSIVRAGRIVDSGTLADLRHLTRTSVTATLADPPALTAVSAWPGVDAARRDRDRLVLSVESSAVGDVVGRLGAHGIQALTCQPPTLEELFLSQYRDDVTAGDGTREEVSA